MNIVRAQNRILLLLVALTLVRGLIYASVTIPWWMGHDEDFHFAQIRSLVEQWLSTGDNWPQEMVATFVAFPLARWHPNPDQPPDLVDISRRHTGSRRFSLAYFPYAWLGQVAANQDLLFQLFTYRLVSVFMTGGLIVLAFLSAKLIFPQSVLAQIVVPWLILFTPAFMITASTVRDDMLAILLTSAVFYLLLGELVAERVGWRSGLALGLTILALWTKPTAYFLMPVWGILLLAFLFSRQLGRKQWFLIVAAGGLFTLFLIFLPQRFQRALGLIQRDVSVEGIAYIFSAQYFWDTFAGYWIILGHFVYRLDQVWYTLLFIFLLLALSGLILYIWRSVKSIGFSGNKDLQIVLLALLFVGLALAVLMGDGMLRYDEQKGRLARYIYPAIVPLSCLMVIGWRTLLPEKWRRVGLLFIAGALFLFDTMVWLNYAIPWYYPFWPK